MNLATLSPFGSHFRPELPFCTCTQLYSNADQNSVSKKFDFHGRFEMIFYHFHTFSGEKLDAYLSVDNKLFNEFLGHISAWQDKRYHTKMPQSQVK